MSVHHLPRTAEQRAAVMRREVARKFFTAGGQGRERAGDVPPEGTPAAAERARGGSVLPIVAASRQIVGTEELWAELYRAGKVVPPPYDLWTLVCHVEESDALGPLVATFATQITGYGYRLDPLFPTRDATGNPVQPPAEAVAEREDIELFLDAANIEAGMLGILELADRDREATGNGYIELLRDTEGRVSGVEHAASYTMRLGECSQPVLVEHVVRHPSTGALVTMRRWRRFRTYVQIVGQTVTFFRQYGDPRYINRTTGQYRAESWGLDARGNALDGTEIVHRRIYSAHTPYGVPRWVGSSPHVKAGRMAGELLVSWFEGAPIGAKLALVAGGVWNKESYKAALAKIDEVARGVRNAWTLIALEADPNAAGDPMDDTRPSPPRVGLEDLAYELPTALYQGDDNLLDGSFRRIARMFGLPPVYWGGSDDYSRAAVMTARATTEEQVFVPERRQTWERWFNAELLPSRGVNYWAFRLNGANTTDDAELPIGEIVEGGGVSPNALIALWSELTGREVNPITEPWGDRPLALVKLLVEKGIDPNLPLADIAGEADTGIKGGVDDAQKTALNGAQVTAALEVVQAVPAGTLTKAMAKAMLEEFFNLEPTAADRILVDVESLEPPPPPEPAFGGGPPDGDAPVVASKADRAAALETLADRLEADIRRANPRWFA